MTEKFLGIILPIKEETGLDIELYNVVGDRVATTDPESEKMLSARPVIENGIFQDPIVGVTAFAVDVHGAQYIGAIAGSGEVSRNYASLVARLIETSLTLTQKTVDKSFEFRELLLGECGRMKQEQLLAKYADYAQVDVLVFELDARDDLFTYLTDLAEVDDTVFTLTKHSIVMLKDVKGLEEYQSVSDFAHMVCDNVEQDLGLHPYVGIGERAYDVLALQSSYQQALSALRLGKLLDSKAHVFNTKDYFLVTLFEELPHEKVQSCFSLGMDASLKAVFDDPEMMDTAEQFLVGSLNISETARNMYMHRNTLIYRLDKIEKETGLNIRRFVDAMTFRTLSMLYKLNKKN